MIQQGRKDYTTITTTTPTTPWSRYTVHSTHFYGHLQQPFQLFSALSYIHVKSQQWVTLLLRCWAEDTHKPATLKPKEMKWNPIFVSRSSFLPFCTLFIASRLQPCQQRSFSVHRTARRQTAFKSSQQVWRLQIVVVVDVVFRKMLRHFYHLVEAGDVRFTIPQPVLEDGQMEAEMERKGGVWI